MGIKKVFCPHCHQKVNKGNFCSQCGQKMVYTCDCWITNNRHHCGSAKCWGADGIVEMLSIFSKLEQQRHKSYGVVLDPFFQRRSSKSSRLF